MNITIQLPDMSDFRKKLKEATTSLVNKPVPLGKTVLATSIVLVGVQVVVFRKLRVSVIVTKQ